ncbi:hypothetical protein DAPPUDRAFT_233778 [Daphnia pulex]|uniref:Uncharacterized protein n=1 Tax=Daphnia pulex TaxID=6669 RepID=E9FVP8_DAPPU|nr:hypothetical protein DAPPUDRAFT_233778 [Daphnia pulex]|eukprot:EFX89065.1 hypothetical protein DAPPUDRAFT_233778 [Daphnia pulex]
MTQGGSRKCMIKKEKLHAMMKKKLYQKRLPGVGENKKKAGGRSIPSRRNRYEAVIVIDRTVWRGLLSHPP